ncbi:MAG: hypothetical protein WD027_08200 [Gaiellales bacterium]
MVAHTGDKGTARAARRLNEPRRALVVAEYGLPASVERARVMVIREEWRVVDRWWAGEPVRRRYFEVVLETGRNAVVFHDELGDGWFAQRA